MKQTIPWITSAVTLYSMFLLGHKKWYGWLIGLANQSLWLTTIFMFKEWGLLPLTACLIVLYAHNLRRWRREAEL